MDIEEFIKFNNYEKIDKKFFDICYSCLTSNSKFIFSKKNLNVFKKYINVDNFYNINYTQQLLTKNGIKYELIDEKEIDIENYHKNEKVIALEFFNFKFFFIKVLNINNEDFLTILFNSENILNKYLIYGFRFLLNETEKINKKNEIKEKEEKEEKEIPETFCFNVFYITKEINTNETKFFLKVKNNNSFKELQTFINSNKFIFIKLLNNSTKIIEHIKISFFDYLNPDGSYSFISVDVIEECLNNFIKIENDIQKNLTKIKKNVNINNTPSKQEENLISLNTPKSDNFVVPIPPPLPPPLPSSLSSLNNLTPPLIPVKNDYLKNIPKTPSYDFLNNNNTTKPDPESLFISLKKKISYIREKKGYSSDEDTC